MLPLSIKEVRYEVYEVISAKAEKGKDKIGSRGNFFSVGLGGGTGTGVISPLAEQFGKGSRGYFTLGILGGKDDNKYLGS
jgi:cell division GTPase FtsZ